MISLIAALDRNRVIGVRNALPWRLPDDLKRFKALTLDHRVVMGRKTFESIGRPLPSRANLVVTRQMGYAPEGVQVVHDLDAALTARADEEVFVIGGAEVYAQTIDRADRLYLTEVETAVEGGDAFFPVIDRLRWRLAERIDHVADAKHAFSYAHLIYERA